MKLSNILQKVKIVAALGRVVFGGKVGKILEKTEQGADLAESVKDLVKSETKVKSSSETNQ